MAGGLGDKGGAVPVLAWVAARRVQGVTCPCGEMAVIVDLADLIGDRLDGSVARNALDGSQLTLDPLADVNETTAIVHRATRNGVIILGGGSPKNFYLQTQPQLWEVLGIHKGGHDYFIQITADAPHWGGLSGATPSEAVSWGKIKPDQLNSTVVIYGDSTIALPLLTAYVVSKAQPRPRKELFSKREQLLKELKEAYNASKAIRP